MYGYTVSTNTVVDLDDVSGKDKVWGEFWLSENPEH